MAWSDWFSELIGSEGKVKEAPVSKQSDTLFGQSFEESLFDAFFLCAPDSKKVAEAADPHTSKPIGYGIGFEMENGGIRVATVAPGSPAHQCGIQVGDVLVEVGGRSVSGTTLQQLLPVFKHDAVSLGLVRVVDNRPFPVRVDLQRPPATLSTGSRRPIPYPWRNAQGRTSPELPRPVRQSSWRISPRSRDAPKNLSLVPDDPHQHPAAYVTHAQGYLPPTYPPTAPPHLGQSWSSDPSATSGQFPWQHQLPVDPQHGARPPRPPPRYQPTPTPAIDAY
mmetsp:Transcript_25589/g.58977  ORF Transcript_25589/g.58977 Transcript_25589/m.58977 type:complete len:279 (+) Transcript_25589:42-878(+)